MTEHLLLQAAFKKPIARTPVWVMRQAGRYLPEYRATRAKAGDFLGLCKNVDLAVEVTLQPLDIIGVDGVILFSDILTPLEPMGLELSFNPSPVFANPLKSEADIDNLRVPDPAEGVPYVGAILKKLRVEVRDRVPVIGFAGAPFTLACYAVEGGGSKLFSKTKSLFFDQPKLAFKLMDKLTDMTISYLNYQIDSGAQMVQLFDTWAGSLCPDDYDRYVFPWVAKVFAGLKGQGLVPRCYYINGGAHLLERMAQTGADVVGLDWMSDLGTVKARIGHQVALQGNLDPNVLFASPDVIRSRVKEILDKWGKDSGHIFNLGHGIDKDVNPEHLKAMVAAVKEFSVR